MSLTPREARPRVSSAVVTSVYNGNVLLVDSGNAGSSMSSAFVPVIGGQEQWLRYDLTSTTFRLIIMPKATACLKVHVLCLFVCL